MRVVLTLIPALVLTLGPAVASAHDPERTPAAELPGPRNIIFFLGDGMGPAQVKAYRLFADDPSTALIDPLPIDRLQVGSVATESIVLVCADGGEAAEQGTAVRGCRRTPYGVSDSAASATAYATGVDTVNGMLGLGPEGTHLTTILERAAAAGWGTGVVSTSQVTHASPAAFVAHVPARRMTHEIADQFFDNQHQGRPVAQVILGGGVDDFRREDRDVAAQFVEEAGYTLVSSRAELQATDADRILGLFAPVGLPRQWDRPETVPSLADMTGKAIETLARNDQGFFLFVEGSQIDWAAHGNDIAWVVSEMADFMAAIDIGLEFAEGRDDTLLVVTADHETGGLSIGRDGVYAWNPEPLRSMTATPALIVERYVAGEAALSSVLAAHGSFDLGESEQALLDATPREAEAAYAAVTRLLDEKTFTGWTTGGHTGVDVALYASGPGSETLRGTLENEVLGQKLLQLVPAPDGIPEPWAVNAVIDGFVEQGYLALLYTRIEDRDGRLLYEYGARQPGLVPEPVRGDSWFRIWSMSKIITISLALDLAEEGVISLDDPVTRYLPELSGWRIARGPGGEDLVEVPFEAREALCPTGEVAMERPPTVRDLINHQDGLYYPWTGMPCLDAPMRAAQLADAPSREVFIQRLADLPLINAPGTRENYGLGTTVLGLVLEQATGQALDALVAERITGPLGIEGLAYRLPPGETLPPRFIGEGEGVRIASPEELDIFGGAQPRYSPGSDLFLGGEGMVGTGEAYADFARMLLRRGELDGYRLLDEATVAEMTAPHTELDNEWGYNGYNLWISNGRLSDGSRGPAPLWMGGGYEGTRFWIDPEREVVGVIMTQVHQPPPGADRVDELIRQAVYAQLGWEGSEP